MVQVHTSHAGQAHFKHLHRSNADQTQPPQHLISLLIDPIMHWEAYGRSHIASSKQVPQYGARKLAALALEPICGWKGKYRSTPEIEVGEGTMRMLVAIAGTA
jgi:hypothetical protein